MTRVRKPVLAWALFALSLALSAAGVALLAQVPGEVLDRAGNSFALSTLFVAILLVFGLVGAVVASRLPTNPIGWLFLALALIEGVFELAFGYTHYSLHAGHGALPGEVWMAWLSNWTSPLSPPLLVAALLLFPDGRPPSPRWRWVLWACPLLIVLALAQYAFAPGPLDEFPAVTNPVGIEGLADVSSDPFVFALLVAAAAGLAVRFRRSRGVERQQLKWFVYAAAVMAGFLVLSSLAQSLLGDAVDEDSIAAGFVFAACISGVPIAAGIAILRHRLYDIDVVINRTLVYGALTASLGGTYLLLVLLIGLTLGESGVAVAASTLAVAALFRPARARIQDLVDRRFYRRRYDAARTLDAFGARLRDEVDLETLAADLRGVAHDTLQPAHVSLWLRSTR
jgi:hypothetical protein